MKRKIFNLVISAGVLVVLFGAMNTFAETGTATGTASSGRGGQDCGKISKKSGRGNNTGGMTVKEVKVGSDVLKVGVDYTIRSGTDGSTRPVIEFKKALAANKDVKVTLETVQSGTFDVILTLTHC